ncbi:hypothetical protein OQA88_11885 [Cercophora sp. LCS_1]
MEDGTKNAYKYKKLEPGEIRILRLRPGKKSDEGIYIEINHEKLDPNITPYNALSWQWGTKDATVEIQVANKDEDVGHSLMIRPNLFEALKRLRHHSNTVRLWVDAVCINQAPENNRENNNEKSNQIALMTKIYSTAKEVSVWLGKTRDDSGQAMKFVRDLMDLNHEEHIAGLYRGNSNRAGDLEALIKLLKRGWFSRRWVVQEIAMARNATVYCGSDSVAWHELADAIALLERFGRDGSINRELRRLALKGSPSSQYDGSFSSLPAYRLVQNTTGMFRGQGGEDIRTWRYTLEELVSFLAAFQASRLHDTIYALLGLASDVKPEALGPPSTTPNPSSGSSERPLLNKAPFSFHLSRHMVETFKVDYSLAPLKVFIQFLEHAIKRSKSLDIVCRPWAPESGVDADGKLQKVELPSWIPSLERKPFRPTRDRDMVRFNPDPLVGPATSRHRFYQASGSRIMEPEFAFLTGSELKVGGFEIGRIAQVWASGSFGNVPGAWLRAGGWESEDKRPPDALWRTLVADRNAGGDGPDRWYPMVFQTAAKDRGIDYGFETHRLIHESTNTMVAELFRRVQAVVWNRQLITVTGVFPAWLREEQDKWRRENELNEEQGPEASKSAPPPATPYAQAQPVEPLDGSTKTVKSESKQAASVEATVGNNTTPEEKGKAFGLSPADALVGDLVCIIFGCSVPLVLRPVGAKYKLIGECYVDHAMDGEAMTYFQSMEKKKKRSLKEVAPGGAKVGAIDEVMDGGVQGVGVRMTDVTDVAEDGALPVVLPVARPVALSSATGGAEVGDAFILI